MGQPSRSSSSLLSILLGLLAAGAGLMIGFIDEIIGGDYRTVEGKVVVAKETEADRLPSLRLRAAIIVSIIGEVADRANPWQAGWLTETLLELQAKEDPARGRGFGDQDDPLISKGPQIAYEYQDEKGKVHLGKHSLSGNNLKPGQTLWIRYDRQSPAVSYIAEAKPSWHWIAMGGLLVLGVILVLVGVRGLVRRPALSTASPPAEPAPSPGPVTSALTSEPKTSPTALTSEPKNEG
jgi:hypothetical protein